MNKKTGPFIVALDLGTSGCRAVAVAADGTVVCEQRQALAPIREAEGISYYQADELLEVQLRVLNDLLDQLPLGEVAAISVSSQRSTVVLWDVRSGAAVAPVLTWEDGRAVQEVQQADISQEQVHHITGLYKIPYFSAPKIAWCLKHLPAVQKTLESGNLSIAPVASYFIWKLTRGTVFATDASLAQRTLLFDIHTWHWSSELCGAFGIDKSNLPDVGPSAGNYGFYTYQGADIPILGCVADQQAAAYWFDLKPQQSCINYGTGAFWLYHAGETPASAAGMLTSVAAQVREERNYFLEGPVNSAGSIFLWLKEQGMLLDGEDWDDLCRQAKEPVLLLPALGGLGAPYFDFSVDVTVAQLSVHTRRADWAAGAARGLAFLLADIAAYLQQQGYRLQGPVMAAGGLAHLNYLLRFQADILQLPLQVGTDTDATVLGAAKLAAHALGWDISRWNKQPGACIAPQLTKQEAGALYQAWQQFIQRVRKK